MGFVSLYNLQHIRYFLAAAEAQSLVKAAKACRVSQSAVSQAIIALEVGLGLSLISHERKVFRLTDEGAALLPQCRAMLASAEDLGAAADGLKGGYGGALTLGCTNSLAAGLLPGPLRAYTSRAPAVQTVVKVGNSEVIKQWLLAGEIELGLAVKDRHLEEQVDTWPVQTGRYVLVKQRQNEELVFSSGLVVTRRDRPEVRLMRQALAVDGVLPPVGLEIISWEAIKAYISQGTGYGILPDYMLTPRDVAAGLEVVPVPGAELSYEIVAATKQGRAIYRNAALLLALLTEGAGGGARRST